MGELQYLMWDDSPGTVELSDLVEGDKQWEKLLSGCWEDQLQHQQVQKGLDEFLIKCISPDTVDGP